MTEETDYMQPDTRAMFEKAEVCWLHEPELVELRAVRLLLRDVLEHLVLAERNG